LRVIIMNDCLYADFRIRPKHGSGRQRQIGDSRHDRRQAYALRRSEKKERDLKFREAKTSRLGNKDAKGQRAWTCRPWRGKRGWVLMMCAAEEDEKHDDDINVLTICFQTEEHCAKRWDAAVCRAEETHKRYPAFDMRSLHILGSIQYRSPANPFNGPAERLPALQIVWPSPYASDFTSRVVCPICCTHQTGLIPGCASNCHVACLHCWSRWAGGQADRMRWQREFGSFTCFGDGCHEVIDQRIWEMHPETRKLQNDLARRHVLQQNVLYPTCVQVDCPIPGCMGLGYLGHDTVMCFICEHQWPADNGKKPSDAIGLSTIIKACSRCNAHIEKNGGCDHMTCPCGYEFWWSTLNPYR
jgi:hypothetical protein